MAHIKFPCGCKFKIVGDDAEYDVNVSQFEKLPRVDINLDPHDPNSMYRVSTLCDLTWDMIGRGATKGVFQLEKQLGQQWAKLTKPNKLEDLGALVALLRPGCLLAMSGDPPKSMTQRYADRKMGKEEVVYLHESIADILETTYGVLTYQEQAMRIAERVAAFNKQEADVLRKAIGKKKADIMAKVEKNFLEKAEKAGVITLEEAKEIFGWIRESQKYSFNACLSPDTIVETNNGFKLLNEVNIGDKVLSPISDNKDDYIEVLNIHNNGNKELYEIVTESGKTLQCTMDHKIKCEDGELRPLWEIIENNLKIVCETE